MQEKIIELKGYEGIYLISNKGYIKSVQRTITMIDGRKRTIHSKILKTRKNNMGYHILDLYKDGIKKTFMLHRLVAMNFIKNPNIMIFNQVNHKNGNKDDNNAINLEWCNNSLNVKHAHDNNLNKISKEAKEKMRKNVLGKSYKERRKKVGQYDKNNNLIKIYSSITEASKSIGISRVCIRDSINNRRGQKTAKGFIWKFIV